MGNPVDNSRATFPDGIIPELSTGISAIFPQLIHSLFHSLSTVFSPGFEQAYVVFEDDLGGGAAMVKALERATIIGIAEHGTGRKQLV